MSTYRPVRYDNGKPICEICGQSFHRLMNHVRQKHGLSAREYKERYGLDVSIGICSEESAEKVRVATLANADVVISQNLIKGGKDTRFKKGHPGRKNPSPQTIARFLEIRHDHLQQRNNTEEER